MPPKRVQRSRSRQTTPQSPPKPSASYASPRQTRRSIRSQSHEIGPSPPQAKRAAKALPAVDEESAAGQVEDAPQDAISDVHQPQSISDDELVSDDDVSDTSSNGNTQLDALDTDLIVDNLSAIYLVATQILSLLDYEDVHSVLHEINNPRSRRSARLRNCVSRFTASREAYGSGSYINIPLILKKLVRKDPLPDGPWRPDSILQLANLSLLMAELSYTEDSALYDTLERMFNAFPEPFARPGYTPLERRYNTRLVAETVSFAVDLKTQFFLRVIDRKQNDARFEPDTLLKQVFHDEEAIQNIETLGQEFSHEAADAISKRFDTIQSFFRQTGGGSIDLHQLKSKYSWPKFLDEALRWASLRKQELEMQIVAQGGVESIEERLRQKTLVPYEAEALHPQATPKSTEAVAGRRNSQNTDLKANTPQQPQSSRPPSGKTMHRRVVHLKTLKGSGKEGGSDDEDEPVNNEVAQLVQKEHPASSFTANSKHTVAEIPQSPGIAAADEVAVDGAEDDFADGDDDQQEPDDEATVDRTPSKTNQNTIIPTQQTLAVLEVARQQAVLGNKENIDIARRYADKQSNAKRIEWDDSQTGQKRARRDDSIEQEEEDDDFEVDDRPQKRRRMPRRPPPNAVDDWIVADGDDEVAEPTTQLPHNDASHSSPRQQPPPATQPLPHRSPLQQRRNAAPSSSAPEPRAPSTQQRTSTVSPPPSPAPAGTALEYREANAEAKAVTRIRPLIDPTYPAVRAPQTRRAWSDEETQRLIDLVGVYGCSWARILSEDADHPDGPELQSRGQVMLKDRARHMKYIYLKGGKELPPGFAAVSVGKKERETLDALSIPWRNM